jgi:UDPglucose 6-dehydrogenase
VGGQSANQETSLDIGVIGTGYVGLVTGACFAEMGNSVICVDTDAAKIAALQEGKIPIYEPGLEPMVVRNHAEGRLRFTTSLAEATQDARLLFIAVGTPPNEDGSADLAHVLGVAKSIGELITEPTIVIDKSTVPVGTADKVRTVVQKELDRRGIEVTFDVVSNPEFLKEGAAIDDFMRPDRVIVGTDSERTAETLRRLYAPFTRNHDRMLVMSVRDAEMTKYVANSMLATKISFMNEIAGLCERMGVDVENVRKGIGSDARIGYSFIYPGCGYGGSCFPKDVDALIRTAGDVGANVDLLKAVQERNCRQKRRLFEKIVARFGGDLSGHVFGVWGLAFKPGTDDVREAPAIDLIRALVGAGAVVQAYDPVATETARHALNGKALGSGKVSFAEHQDDALDGASALVLVTEWKQFREPNFANIKKLLKYPVIFDGRNQYDPKTLREAGFDYVGIGR